MPFLRQHEHVKASSDENSFVKHLRAFVIADKATEESAGGGADCHSQQGEHWIVNSPISTPMSIFEEYKSNRKHWGIDALGTMIVEVELQNGMKGHGITIAGEPGCFIVEKHFARFVEGQSVNNIELMWENMWRASVNYGRKGLVIQALSAVDLALWDALGKLRGQPVFNLLGGKTKDRLPVYATTARPDLAQQMGFIGAKIPLPYGPIDGDEGLNANIERIKDCCRAIRPGSRPGQVFPLMLDCYMSLNVNYTLDLLNNIKKHIMDDPQFQHVKIKWLEEFCPPDDYDGYKKVHEYVKSSTGLSSMLLTAGEHEYTRYGFRKLLEDGSLDILQPDISWMGGITEARRMIAMAAAYDVFVVPHGSSIYSYHLQIAFNNCPFAEFLVLSPNADRISPLFGDIFVDEPLPKDGYVTLDEKKPGFGVTLNPKLKLKRPYDHEHKSPVEVQKDKQLRVPRTPVGYEGDSAKHQPEHDWLHKHRTGPAKVGLVSKL